MFDMAAFTMTKVSKYQDNADSYRHQDQEFHESDALLEHLGKIIGDPYTGSDPAVVKEIKAIVSRTKKKLPDTHKESFLSDLHSRAELYSQGLPDIYPTPPEIVSLAWAVLVPAIYESAFHPEIHAARFSHFHNMVTLVGGLGEEPRLCLNILRADAWREILRNDIYLRHADQATIDRYQQRVYQRIHRNLQFMYWECGLPVDLEDSGALVEFDWQSPQFKSVRFDKYLVLHDLAEKKHALALFYAIDERTNILRQERPLPVDASLPSWSACIPEYASTSFSAHTKMIVDRYNTRMVQNSSFFNQDDE